MEQERAIVIAPDATNPTVTLDPHQQAAAAMMQAQARTAQLEEELAALRQTQGREPTRDDTQGTGHRRGDGDTQRRRYRDDSRDRSRSRSRGRTRDYERREGRGRNRDRTRSRNRYRYDRDRRPRSDSRDRPREGNWRLERAARQAREDARRSANQTAPRPMRPSATNAVGIDPAYVQPKDRPVSSHSTQHPYQPTVGTQSRPGGDTGLSTGIIHIYGPGENPTATQSSASTGTAGPQTRLQGNQDRADEEEREADVRAEEIYAAMEGEAHQPTGNHWEPPTINLFKRVQQYWMFEQDGEISEILWRQDAEYRRFQAQPPIDDMLRPLIIPR